MSTRNRSRHAAQFAPTVGIVLFFSILLVVYTAVASSASLALAESVPTTTASTEDHHHDGEAEHHGAKATAEFQRELQEASSAHLRECHSPFGKLNGVGDGVTAHSNCNDNTITNEGHYVVWDTANKKIVRDAEGPEEPTGNSDHIVVETGMKWQCVEFARRSLLQKYGLMFQDCEGAFNIWRFPFLIEPGDTTLQKRYELRRFPNFATSAFPQAGDIVIWPIQKDMPYGHIGMLVGVTGPSDEFSSNAMFVADSEDDKKQNRGGGVRSGGGGRTEQNSNNNNNNNGFDPVVAAAAIANLDPEQLAKEDRDTLVAKVQLAEQNYANKDWPDPKLHARELHVYRRAKSDRLALKDPDGYKVLGWMRPMPENIWTGAYSHHDDGVDGIEGQGLPQRVRASETSGMDMSDEDMKVPMSEDMKKDL